MWTCRNCYAENPDELKACAACGEKNVTPPKGAEIKRKPPRKTAPLIVTPLIVTLLKAAACVDAVAGLFVLLGILINVPAGGFMLALCVLAFTLTACALLGGMAVIIQKL